MIHQDHHNQQLLNWEEDPWGDLWDYSAEDNFYPENGTEIDQWLEEKELFPEHDLYTEETEAEELFFSDDEEFEDCFKSVVGL